MRNSLSPMDRNDPHFVAMRQIRDAQKQTNDQIRSVADSVNKLADRLGEFVTAVEVLKTTVANHADDIQAINKREEARAQREEEAANRAAEHRFSLGNNVVYWIIGALGVAFSTINAISFLSQHWK